MFRQLTKGEVKEIADIMLREVFKRADIKGIKIDVTERFKVRAPCCRPSSHCQCLVQAGYIECDETPADGQGDAFS